jgi:hypothetical protein
LDHVDVLQECLRSPPWKGGSRNGRTDDSACAPWFCSDADILVHPLLDVPSEDLSKDLGSGFPRQLRLNGHNVRSRHSGALGVAAVDGTS